MEFSVQLLNQYSHATRTGHQGAAVEPPARQLRRHPPTERGQPRRIGARRLTSIAVTANVTIEAAAIRLAIANEIPLLFFDRIGRAEARLWSPYFASIATLRRQQVRFADTAAASEWMINLFALKTNGQIANLKHLLRRRSREADRIQRTITDMEHGRDDLRRFAGQLLTDCRNQMMEPKASSPAATGRPSVAP